MDELKQAASDGAAYLDMVDPPWIDRIDLTRLDMGVVDACILGQLYGSYENGCAARGLTTEKSAELGFWVEGCVVTSGVVVFTCEHGGVHGIEQGVFTDPRYDALTDYWREEIQRRRCATRGRIVVDSAGMAEMEGTAPALV